MVQCQAPEQHRHVSCKGPLASADYPGPCLPFQVKAQASSGDTASQQLLQRDLPSVVKALARELGAGGKSAKVKVWRSWRTGSCVGLVPFWGGSWCACARCMCLAHMDRMLVLRLPD